MWKWEGSGIEKHASIYLNHRAILHAVVVNADSENLRDAENQRESHPKLVTFPFSELWKIMMVKIEKSIEKENVTLCHKSSLGGYETLDQSKAKKLSSCRGKKDGDKYFRSQIFITKT